MGQADNNIIPIFCCLQLSTIICQGLSTDIEYNFMSQDIVYLLSNINNNKDLLEFETFFGFCNLVFCDICRSSIFLGPTRVGYLRKAVKIRFYALYFFGLFKNINGYFECKKSFNIISICYLTSKTIYIFLINISKEIYQIILWQYTVRI